MFKQLKLFSCAAVLMLVGFGAYPVAAEITFSLTVIRESKPAYESGYGAPRFRALPWLSDTNTPISFHRVEAPNNSCGANFGTNTSSAGIVFNSADQLLDALTNGNWKLWLNRDTPQEEYYEFALGSETITAESFGPVQIIAPRNGGINIASNTPYIWSGPMDFEQINVAVRNVTNEVLAASEMAWTNGPVLPPGTNFFSVVYLREVTGLFAVSQPTNDVLGALTNWSVGLITLRSSAEAGFLSAGLPPSPLAEALDAPGMIWETDGDAEWFMQTTNVTDGVDAAQSGVVADDGSTRLTTVIYGTNTIRFRWRTDSEVFADYVEFTDNGNYVADLTGSTLWQEFTYHLSDGQPHVLAWTYYKDLSDASGADAAFLDQVRLGADILPIGPAMDFRLTVRREQKSTHDAIAPNAIVFSMTPELSVSNAPSTYHEVRSPNSLFKATVGPTNTSVTITPMSTFGELYEEITNGNWSLRLERETPQEQIFFFRLTTGAIESNDLGVVNITMPTNDAVDVLPYTSFAWADGWPDAAMLAVRVFQIRSNDIPYVYADELLDPPSQTTWHGMPPLASGTNFLTVSYTKDVTTNYAATLPYFGWNLAQVNYESSSTSGFVVARPLPVELVSAQFSTAQFQFQFVSQNGFTNVVQSCTNLALGDWIVRTNIPGDGLLKTVMLPIGSEGMEFFRVVTE